MYTMNNLVPEDLSAIEVIYIIIIIVNEAKHYTPVYNTFTTMLLCFHASQTYEINYYKCIDNVHNE